MADPGTWNVICAAIAEKSKLPVRMAATMYLPQSQVQWIPYRAAATRPVSSELRKAQRTLADWNKQGLEHLFIASQDANAKLGSQRIEYLESRLGKGLPVPEGMVLASGPEETPANAVGMAAAQSINVTSTPATDATPTAVTAPTAVTTPTAVPAPTTQ